MSAENTNEAPKRLYKYRHFDDLTIECIVHDMVYFADPRSFNDPLDTRPSLELDVDEDALREMLKTLVKRRTKDEVNAATKTGKIPWPTAADDIETHSRLQAEQVVREVEYNATNPDDADLKSLLGHYIEGELLRRYQSGIFCLAGLATCPLMWSHYGDQHRGICIGYSVPPGAAVHKVSYGGSRLIQASKVAAMLAGNDGARRQVDDAVLLRKASPWRYEREWRLIGPQGLQFSTLEMEELIFGIKCGSAVKYTLLKALECRERPVEFSEISEVRGSFPLRKRPLDCPEQLLALLPQRSLSIFEGFEAVTK